MKVQTFIGKVSMEGLLQMDEHINEWLGRTGAAPERITQCCGSERHHDGNRDEPVLLTSIWYEDSGAE